jgi:hypothetical protein
VDGCEKAKGIHSNQGEYEKRGRTRAMREGRKRRGKRDAYVHICERKKGRKEGHIQI